MAEYIDRDMLLKKKHGCDRKDCSNCDFFTDGDSWCQGELFAVDVLNAPAADVVERKTGKWISYIEDGYLECPFCGAATNCDGDESELHFCFSCGAKMEGVRNDV